VTISWSSSPDVCNPEMRAHSELLSSNNHIFPLFPEPWRWELLPASVSLFMLYNPLKPVPSIQLFSVRIIGLDSIFLPNTHKSDRILSELACLPPSLDLQLLLCAIFNPTSICILALKRHFWSSITGSSSHIVLPMMGDFIHC
jgi:hypothetical protein